MLPGKVFDKYPHLKAVVKDAKSALTGVSVIDRKGLGGRIEKAINKGYSYNQISKVTGLFTNTIAVWCGRRGMKSKYAKNIRTSYRR